MDPDSAAASGLRIGYVPGVTLKKWTRVWGERAPGSPLATTMVAEDEAVAMVRAGALDMCFVRLPVDRDGMHLIPLYAEVPVVVLPKEHVLTLLDEVTVAELADEMVLGIGPDLSAKQAIETVAAGTGVVTVPMSIARLHHRKDVAVRPVTDLPETEIGLTWLKENDDPRIETFIGVVRGRTVRSSRAEPPSASGPVPKGRRDRGASPARGAKAGRRRGRR